MLRRFKVKLTGKLNQRPRLFVSNRLDNVPRLIEHLNLGATVAGALPWVARRRVIGAPLQRIVGDVGVHVLRNYPAKADCDGPHSGKFP